MCPAAPPSMLYCTDPITFKLYPIEIWKCLKNCKDIGLPAHEGQPWRNMLTSKGRDLLISPTRPRTTLSQSHDGWLAGKTCPPLWGTPQNQVMAACWPLSFLSLTPTRRPSTPETAQFSQDWFCSPELQREPNPLLETPHPPLWSSFCLFRFKLRALILIHPS